MYFTQPLRKKTFHFFAVIFHYTNCLVSLRKANVKLREIILMYRFYEKRDTLFQFRSTCDEVYGVYFI